MHLLDPAAEQNADTEHSDILTTICIVHIIVSFTCTNVSNVLYMYHNSTCNS